MKTILSITLIVLLSAASADSGKAPLNQNQELDRQALTFLQQKENAWGNWNVPTEDGELLHDLIVENGYKNILEIGTSTGKSTIYLALAASKTGGNVTTIEINEDRYQEALENFKKAGVSEYIDARLADAHELVKTIEGPFDFVFCDADKTWYTNYFKAIYPKMSTGGCYTAHNVTMNLTGIDEFMNYLESHPGVETSINNESGSGVSISYKLR